MTDDGGARKYIYRACHVSIMSRILGNQPQLSAQEMHVEKEEFYANI